MNEITTVEQRGTSIAVREDFGGNETRAMAETASTAVAASARAAVEARYIMAYKRPRDWDDVRAKLLKECSRPGFAETAWYHKPIGKGVEGPSIRFAEAAMRCMGNLVAETHVTFDDATKRIVRVTVTDLEANMTYPKDIVVEKTVERSSLKDGQQALGSRTNSYGKRVYLVAATEDDLLNKENALCSKALRSNGLRILPGDIIDECKQKVKETIANKDAADPDAARKRIADSFAQLNVMPSQLRDYLGHDLAQCTPAELGYGGALWMALRDGETTWTAVMENEAKEEALKPAAATGAPATATDQPKPAVEAKGTAGLKDKLAARKQQQTEIAATPQAAEQKRQPGEEG